MTVTALASTLTHLLVAQVFAASAVSVTLPEPPEAPVIEITAQRAPLLLAQAEPEKDPAPKAKAKKKPAPKAKKKPVAKTEATEAERLTAKVQAFYEKTTDFSASFEQRYTYQVLGRSTKSAGTVAFKKGGLMRWDYVTPRKKAFIVDGDTLWVYTPEDHTVIKRPDFKPGSLSSSITFLWGEGDLAKEFEITLVAESTLRLVPKTAQSGFARLRFVVDPKTGQVLESTVIDAQGNTNHLVFSEAKLNTGIDAKRFEFKPPKGVSIQVLGDSGLQ